ncbi:LPS export ABC transporter permease LptF [Dongia sp.]|uniref:LPS export ABC transporter permease LptF n=1 Tax=Dongia sp. TaxID=1977262 RepID=UPI0035AE0F07
MKFLRIDLYILKRVALPLLATVGIAMAALLLERLIRLLDLFANRGGPMNIVLKMLANLVPHYLGIAVPAALFVGVLYASMRLSSDSELDAMRASGLSLRRLMMPILALSVVLVIASAYLIGFLQPYTRFAYRALVHLVVETAWDSAIERGAFFTGFGGKTILIGDISEGGSRLSKIFVKEIDDNGQDIVTTAESGQLERNSDLSLVLTLHNGVRTEAMPGTTDAKAVEFTEIELPMDTIAPEPFRNRGERESELDFIELVQALFNTPPALHIDDVKAELNSRLVRTISIIFLPLLAMPIGVSSRRTSKGMRMLVGILFLVAYFQILQFGRDAVGAGILGPVMALWVPFAVFGSISIWLFYLANSRPGADPLAHVFESISDSTDWLWKRTRRALSRRTQEIAE